MNNQTVLIECSDGYYGDKCHIACGKCLHERGCDRLNGTCYHGCKKHFKEPECTGKKIHISAHNYCKLFVKTSFFFKPLRFV